jgi:integrase
MAGGKSQGPRGKASLSSRKGSPVIKFKHLKRVKDRHGGADRYYFRLASGKFTSMRGEYGSLEFVAHHVELMAQRTGNELPPPAGSAVIPFRPKVERHPGHELDAMLAVPEKTAVVVYKPGTLGWATVRWLASREFAARPEGTQTNYRQLAELVLAHPIAGGPVADLRSKHLIKLCREIEEERGLSRGRALLAVVSNVWEYIIEMPQVKMADDVEPINPARVAYRKVSYKVRDPHKRWPEMVLSKFIDGAADHLRLMFALLLYTGQRRSDVRKMKWSDYDSKARVLNVWQKKTKEWVPVPVHKRLAKILAETPRIDDYILTSGLHRKHYQGESSLSHAVANRLVEVGIPKGRYKCHGLRVTAAHILAEHGCDELELMRIFGWKKPEQAHYYVREANKAKIARRGMAKWEAADDDAA